MHRFLIVGIVLLTVPAFAQDGRGDLNCNGVTFEIGDVVLGLEIIGNRCVYDFFEQCTVDNGDVDEDGIPLTISDVLEMLYLINNTDLPDFSRHPESDTIMIQSADAAPGETIELPLLIRTVDTLTAFQFTIRTDPQYVTVLTLSDMDDALVIFSHCDGYIYGAGYQQEILEGEQISFLPGEYHLADIVLSISPDITEPVTTYVEFLNDPEAIHNTAFGNAPLIIPVTVDGEIRIIPTGIDDRQSEQIPRELAIDVYPNPFNGSTNITVRSDFPTELVIYDIMGRVVRRFSVEAGLSRFGWDATDDNGASLSSGVFFARLENSPARYSKRIVFLK